MAIISGGRMAVGGIEQRFGEARAQRLARVRKQPAATGIAAVSAASNRPAFEPK
jgi:hypothetical protein